MSLLFFQCLLFLLTTILHYTTSTDCLYGFGGVYPNELQSGTDIVKRPSQIGFSALYGKKIVQIAAGREHSIALDDSGITYAWGSNEFGNLCFPGEKKIIPARTSFDDPSVWNITRIFAAYDRTFLKDSNNNIYGCGSNSHYSLGDATKRDRTWPTYSWFASTNDVVQIATGDEHTLFLRSNGELWGLGDNGEGSVGTQSEGIISSPEQIIISASTMSPSSNASESIHFTMIAAGEAHSLALSTSGHVFSWGRNTDGECGDGNNPHAVFHPFHLNMSSILSAQNETISQISSRSKHSMLLSSHNRVICFGLSTFGACGTPVDSDSDFTTPQEIVLPSHLEGEQIQQVAAGNAHSVLLFKDGKVFFCGRDILGILTDVSTPTFVQIPLSHLLSDGEQVSTIELGIFHALLLTSHGHVLTYGVYHSGQLGIEGARESERYSPTFVNLEGPLREKKVVDLSAKYRHLMFLEGDGTVVAALFNSHGELADGSTRSRLNLEKLSILTLPIYDIAVGQQHSLFLNSKGKLFAAGSNARGAAGLEIEDAIIPRLTPLFTVGNERFIAITAGESHSAAVTDQGVVYAFGSNSKGQCANNDSSVSNVMTPSPIVDHLGVLQGEQVVEVAAGDKHTLLLTKDANVYCFGDNSFKQCGLGTEAKEKQYYYPVPVKGALSGKKVDIISAGHFHNLALCSDRVTVTCWGFNLEGACTRTATMRGVLVAEPTVIDLTGFLATGETVVHVSAGYRHSLFLFSSGRIFAAGSNEFFNLGLGEGSEKKPYYSLVQVDTSLLPSDLSSEQIQNMKVFAAEERSFISFCPETKCFGKRATHPMVCSQRGSCLSNDHCSCTEGYGSFDCSLPLCGGILSNETEQVCSGSGICVGPNRCFCSDGFRGLQCEIFTCNGIPFTDQSQVCSGHGRCSSLDTCQCAEGFEGHFCEIEYECFGILQSDFQRVCSRNGQCVGDNNCECLEGFSGSQCEIDEQQEKTKRLIIILLSVAVSVVTFLVFGAVVTCCTVGICYGSVRVYKQYRAMEREKTQTQSLLQGFIQDQEMDTIDEDASRARLIIRDSMLEVDFSELKHLQKIGSGGSGAILFRGEWNDSKVAVKVFKCGVLTGDHFFAEFEHEVGLMSALRHRNIVNFYGCSLAYPRIAIIMELCEAGSLEDVIVRGTLQNKSSHQLLQILLDIAEGMNYLHSRGVIHRDLKCANILLDSYNVAKVTDFGLSKFTADQASQAFTTGIGTSYYIAPEVARGSGEYNESVDVYAFGLVAMEVLLGRMCPFPGVEGEYNAQQIQWRALEDASFRPDLQELDNKYAFLHWMLESCWDVVPRKRPPFRDIVKILRSSLFDSEE